eukprot:2263241-Amphidinium_carterae.1
MVHTCLCNLAIVRESGPGVLGHSVAGQRCCSSSSAIGRSTPWQGAIQAPFRLGVDDIRYQAVQDLSI